MKFQHTLTACRLMDCLPFLQYFNRTPQVVPVEQNEPACCTHVRDDDSDDDSDDSEYSCPSGAEYVRV